jgi:hypothetical protein
LAGGENSVMADLADFLAKFSGENSHFPVELIVKFSKTDYWPIWPTNQQVLPIYHLLLADF